MAHPERRISDKKRVLSHFRDNWIQWLTFFMITWGVIGKPAKDIGNWAYKVGTLTERFDIHCARDSVFKTDVFHFMDANAQELRKIKSIIERTKP